MAYVEAHATLREHPKTKRLARLLDMPRPHVIGHLLNLWWWCQDYAQDGNLSGYSASEIAEASEWTAAPELFVESLLTAGFLEEDADGALIVHDWCDYGGKLFVKRQQAAKRQANWRARHVQKQDVTEGNVSETLPVTVSNALVTHYVTHSNGHREDKTIEDKTREDEIRRDVSSVVVNPAYGMAIRAYENDIGLVSGSLADDMADTWQLLESNGTSDWWQLAITAAVSANKRSWRYMRGILTNCLTEGHPPGFRREDRRNGSGPAEHMNPALQALRIVQEEDARNGIQ